MIDPISCVSLAAGAFKTLKTRLKLFLGKFYIGLLSYPQETFIIPRF